MIAPLDATRANLNNLGAIWGPLARPLVKLASNDVAPCNVGGFTLGAGYNLTDYLVLRVSYSHAWNLRDNLVGGQVTGERP